MKVLLAHNRYQQPGGEDQVFAAEAALLRAQGHEVLLYQANNDHIKASGAISLLADTFWNRKTYVAISRLLQEQRPDLLHAHNIFPVISPSIYYAAKAQGIPVVQTLHNYRLICPSANLFRDGHLCEDCLGRTAPWPGVVHSCYRGSRSASAVTAGMLTAHRLCGTWGGAVTAYIALSDFARTKFIEGGLAAGKIFVKPNSLPQDPGLGSGDGGFALYVGRLVPEKGVRTLLEAWRELGSALPLQIAGSGPLEAEVKAITARVPGVRLCGWLSPEQILDKMKRATVLIVPSEWYEPFGLAAIEAFAVGLPVVASRLGSMASIVEHGRTGRHFDPGSAHGLASQIRWLLANEAARQAMRREARREFEAKYTGERNCERLVEIYQSALGARSQGAEPASVAVL